jgi:uncharacterized protein (DUF302 family)
MSSDMTEGLSFEVALGLPFDAAVERVTEALKVEGFGVLTRADVHTAFKEKLDKEFRPYTILGACNPALAYKALQVRADVGMLLPCNVTVESPTPTTSIVRIINPGVMMQFGDFGGDEALRDVGADAEARLKRVAEDLRESA